MRPAHDALRVDGPSPGGSPAQQWVPPPEESWAVLQPSLGLRGRLLLTQAGDKTLRDPGRLWVGTVPLATEAPGRMRSVFGGWSMAELA